jgi:hypothetical protein
MLATPFLRSTAAWRFDQDNYVAGTYKGDSLIEHWDLYVKIDIPPDTRDFYHLVKNMDIGRLDRLAYTYYANTRLWWVIAEANNIINPIDEMKPGQSLRIPYKSRVDVAIKKALESRGA